MVGPEGYTDGKMSLAGAFPDELAEALQADADERGVDVDVALSGYDRRLLGAELSAGRPVLVSCVVLLPRKPGSPGLSGGSPKTA